MTEFLGGLHTNNFIWLRKVTHHSSRVFILSNQNLTITNFHDIISLVKKAHLGKEPKMPQITEDQFDFSNVHNGMNLERAGLSADIRDVLGRVFSFTPDDGGAVMYGTVLGVTVYPEWDNKPVQVGVQVSNTLHNGRALIEILHNSEKWFAHKKYSVRGNRTQERQFEPGSFYLLSAK